MILVPPRRVHDSVDPWHGDPGSGTRRGVDPVSTVTYVLRFTAAVVVDLVIRHAVPGYTACSFGPGSCPRV